jgi:hypothetical protein
MGYCHFQGTILFIFILNLNGSGILAIELNNVQNQNYIISYFSIHAAKFLNSLLTILPLLYYYISYFQSLRWYYGNLSLITMQSFKTYVLFYWLNGTSSKSYYTGYNFPRAFQELPILVSPKFLCT